MRQALGQAFQQVKPASTGKRRILACAVACGFTFAVAGAMPAFAQSKDGKLKVGLMLPYTGTFAALGTAIENGFHLSAGVGRREAHGLERTFEPIKMIVKAEKSAIPDMHDIIGHIGAGEPPIEY